MHILKSTLLGAGIAVLTVSPAWGCDIARFGPDAHGFSDALGTEVDATGSAIATMQVADGRRRSEDQALERRAATLRHEIADYEARRAPPRLPRLNGNFRQMLGDAVRNAQRNADPPYIVTMRQNLAGIEAELRRARRGSNDAGGSVAANAAEAVLTRLTAMDASATTPLTRLAFHVVGANVADEISQCFGGELAIKARAVSARFDNALPTDAPAAEAAVLRWAQSLRDRETAARFERFFFGRPVMESYLPKVRQAYTMRLPRIDWLQNFPAHAGSEFAGLWTTAPDEAATRVALQLGSTLFGDDRLHCEAPAAKMRAGNAQAQQLLDVASAKTILILAHGFAFSRPGWRYTTQELRTDFADVIALGRRLDPGTAFCTVNWNSEYGIDDAPRVLPDLYLALRLLTDHPAFHRKDRTIAMIGHSAGGNLVKYGYVLTRGTLSEMDRTGIAPTRTRIVTLGTPHLGARLANMGVSHFANGRDTSLMATKARTRGAKTMQTVDRNADLALLNAEFLKVAPSGHVFGFAAAKDEAVEESSATPNFVQGWRIADKDHNGLLVVERGSDYARLLGQAITGQGLGLEQ